MMDPCTIALQTDKKLMAIHNRQELQDAYINTIIDGMDYKTMEALLFDLMDADMDKYTDEELISEVSETYPELLEDTEPVYPTEVTELASNLNTKDGITTPW